MTIPSGGVFHAFDNRSSADNSLAAGNGFVIYAGGLYPYPAGIGYHNGIDPHHSGTKSHLAGAVNQSRLF
jgi:hypothetical protein